MVQMAQKQVIRVDGCCVIGGLDHGLDSERDKIFVHMMSVLLGSP